VTVRSFTRELNCQKDTSSMITRDATNLVCAYAHSAYSLKTQLDHSCAVISLRKLAKEQGIQELYGFRIEPIIFSRRIFSVYCTETVINLLSSSPCIKTQVSQVKERQAKDCIVKGQTSGWILGLSDIRHSRACCCGISTSSSSPPIGACSRRRRHAG
jgi:hypothetical protein